MTRGRAAAAVHYLFVSTMYASAAQAQYRGGPGAGVDAASAGYPIALWIAHTESTNVLREGEPSRGYYDSAGALFNLTTSRPRWSGWLEGNLEYRHYGDDAAEDESLGSAGAFGTAALVPERLNWDADYRWLQARTNPFDPETPANREHATVVSTGPQLDVPLGGRTFLTASATYFERTYELSTDLDSTHQGYMVGLNRDVRTTTRLSLMASTGEASYRATSMTYTVDDLQLGYQRNLSGGEVNLRFGKNRVQRDLFESTDPSLQLTWMRTLTARTTLRLVARRQYTDAGSLVFESFEEETEEPTDVSLTDDVNDRRNLAVSWSLELAKTNISVQLAYFEDDYLGGSEFDADGRRIGVEARYSLSERSHLSASLHGESRKFAVDAEENEDIVARLRYSRDLGEMLDLEFDVQAAKRNGDGSFDERTFRVSLVFVPRRL